MNPSDLHDDSEDVEFTPAERASAAKKSTWVSVMVNILLSTTQITVGIFAKSQALIADGVHSLSDLIADFVVLFANHHSQFSFVVDLVGNGRTWQMHIGCWTHHALGHFGEHDGPRLGVGVAVFEDRGLQLFGVCVVVAAHAPHVAARNRQGRFEVHMRDVVWCAC